METPNADIAALRAEAAMVDVTDQAQASAAASPAGGDSSSNAVPGQVTEKPNVRQQLAGEISGMVTLGDVLILGQLKESKSAKLPECLRDIYTDATVDQLADSLARVLEKYGLSLPDFLSKWAPEIELAAVAVPALFSTLALWKRIGEQRSEAPAPADKKPAVEPEPKAERRQEGLTLSPNV